MRRLETPPYQFALRDEPRLRELFERVLGEPRGPVHEQHAAALRDGVCSLVRRAKAEERQVETVIVALKDIFGIPDRSKHVFTGGDDTPPKTLLLRRVIRWCITEYYGADEVPLRDG